MRAWNSFLEQQQAAENHREQESLLENTRRRMAKKLEEAAKAAASAARDAGASAPENTSNESSRVETHYDVLELPRPRLGDQQPVDLAQIRRRYHELARQYHPDKNHGNHEAAERFKRIAEAYDVLSDARRREAYDRTLPR